MWISKKKYKEMQSKIQELEKSKELYESFLKGIENAQVPNAMVYTDGCFIMSTNTYDNIIGHKDNQYENTKKLEAERDWYKYKYAELLFGDMNEGELYNDYMNRKNDKMNNSFNPFDEHASEYKEPELSVEDDLFDDCLPFDDADFTDLDDYDILQPKI